MRRVRVIPVLLLQNQKLVKTSRFKESRYVGDCINALKIFNEKGVDEIVVIDTHAWKNSTPDIQYVKSLVSECFMPLAYGGGIQNEKHAHELFSMGVEKIILGAQAFYQPTLIKKLADQYGAQSVVISVDVKKDWLGRDKVFIENGCKSTGQDPLTYVKEKEKLGAGEIILHSIDRDGMMGGYHIELIKKVASQIAIPVIALGGARGIADFVTAVNDGGASAVAAGALFVYKGPHRAVLINYPTQSELKENFYTKI